VRVKEGKYGWGTFYMCMRIEKWNLLKLFKEVGEGGWENSRVGKSN
jgi:hypothetical protein